jgi:hypothetical protein
MSDPIIESVIEKLRSRSVRGLDKYGVGLDREDLSVVEWLTHLQEELLDAAGYVEKLIQVMGGRKKKEEVYGPPPPTLVEQWKMEREAIERQLQEANRKQVEKGPVWPAPIYGGDIVGAPKPKLNPNDIICREEKA